ncbi:UDP-glucose 4-epimerase [Caballeronia choica]|jgi:hypothetical protein|uniref:UDP-glucose 4-epimerase n=1 Tax=Caballeronia choica TaxID=326476 RepID=A0A158L024_9BURK|nr:hypothetical protein [Caballeronia choica]SAL86748.1 UDP-glucose 4-epimerase [Caballeronia choica]
MALTGKIDGADWSVHADTLDVPGGYVCELRVEHRDPKGFRFEHRFRHSGRFDSERDAILAGLREGMVWVGLKLTKTIGV